MAQQNQGQTAVIIILSILSLILLVTTWFFWKGYSEQYATAQEASTQNQKLQTDLRNLMADAGKLKSWIGFTDENMPIAEIETAFNDDMQKHAPKKENGEFVVSSTYRVALGQVFQSLEHEIAKNASLDREKKELQNSIANLNAEKDAAIRIRDADVAQARDDLQKERDARETDAANQKKIIDELTKAVEENAQQAKAAIAQAKETQALAEQRKEAVVAINENLTEKLVDLQNPNVTYFDTQITYVSADARTVWINKGRKDGLTPRISFSIYGPSSNNVARDSSKGAIEITRILGPNTAEAKVTESVITDPMMIGDLAYTPVWRPGQKLEFALASGLDVDKDGNSDLFLVKNIIEMNGGVVAAYIDDQSGANEIIDGKSYRSVQKVGDVTRDTIYYVIGDPVDEYDSPKLHQLRSEMDQLAKDYNLQTIKLPELLRLMGYKSLMTVEGFNFNRNTANADLVPGVLDHYSSGTVHESYRKKGSTRPAPSSTPAGFSPLFHKKNGTPPTSSGSVSEIFRPRTPKTNTLKELATEE